MTTCELWCILFLLLSYLCQILFNLQVRHSLSISFNQNDKHMGHFCQVCATFHFIWITAVMRKLPSRIMNLYNYQINPQIGLFFQQMKSIGSIFHGTIEKDALLYTDMLGKALKGVAFYQAQVVKYRRGVHYATSCGLSFYCFPYFTPCLYKIGSYDPKTSVLVSQKPLKTIEMAFVAGTATIHLGGGQHFGPTL